MFPLIQTRGEQRPLFNLRKIDRLTYSALRSRAVKVGELRFFIFRSRLSLQIAQGHLRGMRRQTAT